MARRTNVVIPAIKAVIRRLERFGILPERDWNLDWSDLTAASADQKMDRVVKMATANKTQADASGERIFTVEEMRSEVDKEPLSEADAKVEKPAPTVTDPNKTAVATFTREGDHLTVRYPFRPRSLTMNAISETEFDLPHTDGRYTFQVDTSGKVTGVHFRIGDGERDMKRVEP